MTNPEGLQIWGKIIYREIVEKEKIVFVVSFSDKYAEISRHPTLFTVNGMDCNF